jgi:mRNA interferase RelE/StbE
MTMPPKWTVIFTEQAEKSFAKLGHPTQKEIEKYLSSRVLTADHPRSLGKALKGNLSNYWCYRSGDYRIICKIEDHELVILVVRVAHRKEVYTKH